MNLDTETATHTGMEGHSRSSHKYLLLQVWCGILTVAMVVMAVLLISIKPKSTEDVAPLKSIGSSFSYIQLIKSSVNDSWQVSPSSCPSCSLVLRKDSIHCTKSSLYLIYAQVYFCQTKKSQTKSVILKRNATNGKSVLILVQGSFPKTTVGSVWVAKIVSLREGDSVSLDITDDFLTDNGLTFWGAYQLH